jgi:hypothetical protein
MRIKKNNSLMIRFLIPVMVAMGIICALSKFSYASDKLKPGSRFKIMRKVYLKAVYDNIDNKQLNKESASAYLLTKRHAMKSEVAFQCEVLSGTIITILGPAPKKWYLFFYANRYFVQLDPDFSRGLDVILVLNRGLEGDLDGLNPELFRRLE